MARGPGSLRLLDFQRPLPRLAQQPISDQDHLTAWPLEGEGGWLSLVIRMHTLDSSQVCLVPCKAHLCVHFLLEFSCLEVRKCHTTAPEHVSHQWDLAADPDLALLSMPWTEPHHCLLRPAPRRAGLACPVGTEAHGAVVRSALQQEALE